MTNASCADCGRIVAFRTHDPSEIAECRNCGTWVKRSGEMPGVAVSVKKDGPTARKTALPPRKDDLKETVANPTSNITRSAPKRTTEARPGNGGSGTGQGETLTAASVYASIRDLQKSVHDLRVGQTKLQNNHKDFQSTQKALHEGQKALHSGQKQLFGQYQDLRQGQDLLLERTLHLPDMPLAKDTTARGASVASAGPANPLTPFQEGTPVEGGFFTTPFSSLKIPLIPIHLQDLDIAPQFTDEGTVPAIPAEERSDRVGLIENPLPEPPPYVEPETSPAEVTQSPEPPEAEETSQPPRPVSPFAEVPFNDGAFNDGAFEQATKEEPPVERSAPSSESSESAESEEDSFLNSATHDSPFTIEGPPSDPFTIAGSESDSESDGAPQNEEKAVDEKKENPFAVTPQPFGAKEYSHEPCDIADPFADGAAGDAPSETKHDGGGGEQSPFSQAPAAEALPDEGKKAQKEKSLSQQIAAAKENQGSTVFGPSKRKVYTEPEKSRLLPLFIALVVLIAILGALVFFFTDIFKKEEAAALASPPLVQFPSYDSLLPTNDPRVAEAEEIAKAFLAAKSQAEVRDLILEVDTALLVDFWEPMTTPTIEHIFPGRILENERVAVDFLVQDFGRDERLLTLVKSGNDPFQVDWKSFAECEEVTLLGLAQGTLILDSGDEIDEGEIRTWVQSGQELVAGLDLINFQGFKLHNFTEEVVALAVVLKDSPEFEALNSTLSTTQLKYKGEPAIRAILRVKRIEKEDPSQGQPARLEIVEVLATDWRNAPESASPAPEDELSSQEAGASAENAPSSSPSSEAPAEEENPKKAAEENQADDGPLEQLPPVPDENAPLALREGETPVFGAEQD